MLKPVVAKREKCPCFIFKLTVNDFQLHSFDFPVSITVSVIHYFPVSVLVTVNSDLFFSYCAISVSVTVNRNNTVRSTTTGMLP